MVGSSAAAYQNSGLGYYFLSYRSTGSEYRSGTRDETNPTGVRALGDLKLPDMDLLHYR